MSGNLPDEPPAGRRAAAWFDALYAADPDPWGFETSEYEREKYAATLATLPDRRFAKALEVGCSIGVFTALLAPRCDRLLAVDGSETALVRARDRCRALSQVAIERRLVPEWWPDGSLDLIVMSEVLYFLDRAGVERIAERASASLAPGGLVILVNWLGDTGTGLSGEAAADVFVARFGGAVRTERRPGAGGTETAPTYRLDVSTA